MLEQIWYAMGFLHPVMVHFPIAILLFGGVLAVLGWRWPRIGTDMPKMCLIAGALFSVITMVMGLGFADYMGYPRMMPAFVEGEPLIHQHRFLGVMTTVIASCGACMALFLPDKTHLWKSALIISACVVGWTGHKGGVMVHGNYPQRAIETLMGKGDQARAEYQFDAMLRADIE